MSCFLNRSGRCIHPRIGGDASPEKCSGCVEYRGKLRGMGDVVAGIARATGVASLTNAVEIATGKPCGCGGRRAALNRAMPFTEEGN